MKAENANVWKKNPALRAANPGAGNDVIVADIAVKSQAFLVEETSATKLAREALGVLPCIVLAQLRLVRVDMAAELALVQGQHGVILMVLIAVLDKLVVVGE